MILGHITLNRVHTILDGVQPEYCVTCVLNGTSIIHQPKLNHKLNNNKMQIKTTMKYHPPAMQETLVRFLGLEDPLEKR